MVVVLQIPVSRFIEHRDARRLLMLSALLAGYGFGLTAFAGSIAVYVLAVCVWSVAEIVNAPTQTSLVVRLSPVHGRGRYQGVYAVSWGLASTTAPEVGNGELMRWGGPALWFGCGLLMVLVGLPVYWFWGRAGTPMSPPRAGAAAM